MRRERTSGTPRRPRRNLDENRPPFESLTPEDAQLIAREGGLKCGDNPEFYDALEEVRDAYRAHYQWQRHIVIGNREFRGKIQDALQHISGVKAFFFNFGFAAASLVLFFDEQEQSGAMPDPDHPDRVLPFVRQQGALRYLEDWVTLLLAKFDRQSTSNPEWFASRSAAQPEQMLLAVRLVGVWRKWGGNAELPVGRKSRWIRFLQQAHKKIAQRQIGPDAARKLTDRAIAWSRKVERSIASSGLEN